MTFDDRINVKIMGKIMVISVLLLILTIPKVYPKEIAPIYVEKEHVVIYTEKNEFGVIDVYFFAERYNGDIAIPLPDSIPDKNQIEILGNISYSKWFITKNMENNLLVIEGAKVNKSGHIALNYFIQSNLFSRKNNMVKNYPKLIAKAFILLIPENIKVEVISGNISLNDTILMKGEKYKMYKGNEISEISFEIKSKANLNETVSGIDSGDKYPNALNLNVYLNSFLKYLGIFFLILGTGILILNVMHREKDKWKIGGKIENSTNDLSEDELKKEPNEMKTRKSNNRWEIR